MRAACQCLGIGVVDCDQALLERLRGIQRTGADGLDQAVTALREPGIVEDFIHQTCPQGALCRPGQTREQQLCGR